MVVAVAEAADALGAGVNALEAGASWELGGCAGVSNRSALVGLGGVVVVSGTGGVVVVSGTGATALAVGAAGDSD